MGHCISFEWWVPTLCAIQTHNIILWILWQSPNLYQWIDASCIIQGVCKMRVSLKHLFSTPSCTENVPQRPYCTPQRWKTEKKTTQYLIRITVQIQVHAHNESQLPNILVSVTTLLQCSVVYMGNYFFMHIWMSKKGRTKDILCAQS